MKALKIIFASLLSIGAILGILFVLYRYMDILLKPFYALRDKYSGSEGCQDEMCMCDTVGEEL